MGLIEIDKTAAMGSRGAKHATEEDRELLSGDSMGRYRVERVLGEGTMGRVYLALDTQLSRKVAIKIPKSIAQEDSKFMHRFMREARSAATLRHRNICPVFDFGEFDGLHFISMAYIPGRPLSDFVNPNRPQRCRATATIVRKLALALQEAHVNGLIHRDVKPANVMIDEHNEPIIMDFGLARAIDSAEDSRLTDDGAFLGSPAYMSPEQIRGCRDRIGPACDIYSLGVILYELLTGHVPFSGSLVATIAQVISSAPESPRELRADIDAELADVCVKAMARKIEDRYATMGEFAQALADFIKSPGDSPTDRAKSGSHPSARPARPEIARRANTNPIPVACACGQRLMANGELMGKVVECTTCGGPIVVAEPGQPISRHIEVTCRCGQRFLAKPRLAGKRVKCTSCSQPLMIPP